MRLMLGVQKRVLSEAKVNRCWAMVMTDKQMLVFAFMKPDCRGGAGGALAWEVHGGG